MENKAFSTLQLIAKRLSIPEDKIEDMSKSNDDICRAKMQDDKYLIYSWHVPEETFATVNITNTATGVGCCLGTYYETEARISDIPRSEEKGMGYIELLFRKVLSLKGQNVPINVFIRVVLRKQDNLTYRISYSNPYFKTEFIKAEDYESLYKAIVSRIERVYLLSEHELDPSTFVTIKKGNCCHD